MKFQQSWLSLTEFEGLDLTLIQFRLKIKQYMYNTHVNTSSFSICRFCLWIIVYMVKISSLGNHSGSYRIIHTRCTPVLPEPRGVEAGEQATGAVGEEAVCWAEPLGVYPEMLTQSISVKQTNYLLRVSSCVSANGVIIDECLPVEILNISDIIHIIFNQIDDL